MGKIKARAAQRTVSADLGQQLWLPGSFLSFRLFPGLWEVFDAREAHYHLLGSCAVEEFPTEDFLVVTDWLRGEISIRLQCARRLQIWRLRACGTSGFTATLTRAHAPARIAVHFSNARQELSVPTCAQLLVKWSEGQVPCWEVRATENAQPEKPMTQIFFGCHKVSEWHRIDRRADLAQIGPILHLAGQWVDRALPPLEKHLELAGQNALQLADLGQLDNSLNAAFARVWRMHFGKWSLPRWQDEEHRGFSPVWKAPISPLYLFSTVGRWLSRRLWIDQPDALCLLPAPPSVCHAGQIACARGAFGTFDMRWSKKKLAEILVRCCQSGRYTLQFPKNAHQVRLRRSDRRFGVTFPLPETSELTVALERGKTYHLDRLRG